MDEKIMNFDILNLNDESLNSMLLTNSVMLFAFASQKVYDKQNICTSSRMFSRIRKSFMDSAKL